MTLARIEGERLGYGGRAVLDGVELTLSPGERVALLGRSGSGKTTLLATIRNRAEATGARVALVPQDHGLVPQLSALKNVLMGRLDDHGAGYNLATLLRPFPRDRAAALAVLRDLELEPEADRAVERLSGGQRQRVALARGLYRGGDLLIADEPVSAVDETMGARLLDLAAARFGTVVMALHDVAQARRVATRILGLARGRVVIDAPVAAVDDARIAGLYGG